ncbi:myb/SANT-like DNA-binding domain-containing protein 3 [Eurosta solidaginis]|uniref:myb/SANT-like DNA-binding domain-containing protein 3 n=1 Tax=Eurosta solidaginis TaxID=178769 RepID=UPI003531153C
MEFKGSKNKPRLPNFSSAEETLLISLAEQHASILENKKTDAVFCEQKRKVWEQIDRAFEAQMGVKRGAKNLKEKYENMKRKARKSLAEERQEIYRTGGGRNRSYVDPNTERLAALLGQTATGFANSFDSDVITYEIEAMEKPRVDEASSEILEESMRCIEVPIFEAVETLENTTATDWSSWNPTQLKTKPSEKLAVHKDGKKTTDRQQEFWEEDNKRAVERHQWAKEKHMLEMELLQINLKKAKLNVE